MSDQNFQQDSSQPQYHSELAPQFTPPPVLPESLDFQSPQAQNSTATPQPAQANYSPYPTPPQPTVTPYGQFTPAPRYDQYSRPDMPKSHLGLAIVTIILFCWPLGIVSVVVGNTVAQKWAVGDYVGAEDASKSAKAWALWGIAIGAILLPFIIMASFAGQA